MLNYWLTSGFIGGPFVSKRVSYLKQIPASSPLPKSTALKTSENIFYFILDFDFKLKFDFKKSLKILYLGFGLWTELWFQLTSIKVHYLGFDFELEFDLIDPFKIKPISFLKY